MVKVNLETIAIVGAIGYLAYAYFTKSFPFDGTLDELLGEVKGAIPGAEAIGTDPTAIDPLTGKVGPAINPAAGAADKTLTELEILAATKSQYQGTPPLITGDIQGIGDTSIYNPAIPTPGATPTTPTPTTTPTPAADNEIEECADWCTAECNKLTGTAKTNCIKACSTVCAQGAGATETEDEGSTIPATPATPEEEEEEAAKPNRSLCSSKFNGKCNTECKSPKSSACKECKQVCGESSNYARSYFVKRAFPAYRDFITPVGSEPQMLRRGRARSGFRSYSTRSRIRLSPWCIYNKSSEVCDVIMKLMDVVVLGAVLAGGYYLFTNPDAMKQITDMIGGLGAGLPMAGGEEDPCAAECSAQTQAALAIGMDPEYFQFAYASKKKNGNGNGKEKEEKENGNGGGEDEAKGGDKAEGEGGAEAGGAAPEAEPVPCDCSQYTGGGEATTTPGEDTGEADPMTGESSEPSEGGEEESGGEDEEESGFARAYRTRVRRPQRRFRAYSGYGYAHKYAGWGNGHRVQPGYSGFIPRVH